MWAIIRTRSQPRWLGWLIVIASLGLVASRAFWTSDVWLLPYALFWLSMIIISIRLVRSTTGRPNEAERTGPAAANSDTPC